MYNWTNNEVQALLSVHATGKYNVILTSLYQPLAALWHFSVPIVGAKAKRKQNLNVYSSQGSSPVSSSSQGVPTVWFPTLI